MPQSITGRRKVRSLDKRRKAFRIVRSCFGRSQHTFAFLLAGGGNHEPGSQPVDFRNASIFRSLWAFFGHHAGQSRARGRKPFVPAALRFRMIQTSFETPWFETPARSASAGLRDPSISRWRLFRISSMPAFGSIAKLATISAGGRRSQSEKSPTLMSSGFRNFRQVAVSLAGSGLSALFRGSVPP